MDDYLIMLKKKDVRNIGIFTSEKEGTQIKLMPYWSITDKEENEFDKTSVTTLNELNITDSLVCRTVRISYKEDSSCHDINILHYSGIKDLGIPPSYEHMLAVGMYLSDVMKESPEGKALCHCTEGRGRTGMVLFLMYSQKLMDKNMAIKPFCILEELRNSRPEILEKAEQMRFCIEAMSYYESNLALQKEVKTIYQNIVDFFTSAPKDLKPALVDPTSTPSTEESGTSSSTPSTEDASTSTSSKKMRLQ